MAEQVFDRGQWEALCEEHAGRCAQRCMTPLHFTMIVGQEIDTLLLQVDPEHQDEAIHIARVFGYESLEERRSLLVWVHEDSLQARTPQALENRAQQARLTGLRVHGR